MSHQRGDLETAAARFDEAIAIGEAQLRGNHRLLSQTRRRRAAVYIDQGEMGAAADLLAAVLEVERSVRPSPHPRIGAALVLQARIERARGADESAARLLREAIGEYRALPASHPRMREARRLLTEIEGPG